MTDQQPRIENLSSKKLIGIRATMSHARDKTRELWQSFMQNKQLIKNSIGSNLISMQLYPPGYDGSPHTEFEKWAAVEVVSHDDLPMGFEAFDLAGGMYAVFIHKGANTNHDTFTYIFQKWLPNSNYELDNKPHFEILGDKYKNDNLDSEEEVWIPVRPEVN